MIKKVCLIVDYNMYDVLRHFTKQLGAALERKGIATTIIDPKREPLEPYMFRGILEDPPDFTCSFNTFEPVQGGKLLWDVLKMPHVVFLVDPAIYYLDLGRSLYTIFTSVDRSDFKEMHSQYPHSLFWPHAVERTIKIPKKQGVLTTWCFSEAALTLKVCASIGRKIYPLFYVKFWISPSTLS